MNMDVAFTDYWGLLTCLKIAHKNGCEWDQQTCSYAAENINGHLINLKYAHENGSWMHSDAGPNYVN